MFQALARVKSSELIGKRLRFHIEVEGKIHNYDCLIGEIMNEEARQYAYHKLARLMQACGVRQMVDSDELDDCLIYAVLDGDEITDVLPLVERVEVEPEPRWKRAARWVWADFARAPVSGAAILTAQTAAGFLLLGGQVDRAMLCLILSQLWIIQRGPMQ